LGVSGSGADTAELAASSTAGAVPGVLLPPSPDLVPKTLLAKSEEDFLIKPEPQPFFDFNEPSELCLANLISEPEIERTGMEGRLRLEPPSDVDRSKEG